MKKLLIFLCCQIPLLSQAQVLSLDSCFAYLERDHPQARQYLLAGKIGDLRLSNLRTGYFPQLEINGQATLQSSVFQIPVRLPGTDVPEVQKDQYKLSLDLSQPLFDGGAVNKGIPVQKGLIAIQQQQTAIEIYKLREKIIQLFYTILLGDRQVTILNSQQQDLHSKILKAEAGLKNGTMLPATIMAFKSESYKISQRIIEQQYSRNAALVNMSILTGQTFPQDTKPVLNAEGGISEQKFELRPEMQLFRLQNQLYDYQDKLSYVKRMPRLSVFAQGIYGNPVYDMYKDEFTAEWMIGLRLKWSLYDWGNYHRESEINRVSKEIIKSQEEIFRLSSNMQLTQQEEEIRKYQNLLLLDDSLIQTREHMMTVFESQLEHGIITTAEFITEYQATNQAKETRELHLVQLNMAHTMIQQITGKNNETK